MAVRMIRFTGILLVLFVARATPAEETPRTTLEIPRVSKPPKLEDFLGGRDAGSQNDSRDDSWAEVTDFRQREPGDGIQVSQETRAYLAYDDQNLFVVFVCKDDPGKVRARMAKREDILSDDQVVLYLDTFRDGQRAYLFAANPHGIQLDGIITEGQDDDFSFDTLWRSDGRLTPDGYAVRMSVPFKSIRFPNDSEQAWGIALGRVIPRTNEESYWPYITKRIDGIVRQFSIAQGLNRISPGRNLQLIPHGILTRARFLDPDVPGMVTATDKSVGLDGKLVLRDAFALDVTLNPDFSQVESDEPQVTINQRFEVFFPETRALSLRAIVDYEVVRPNTSLVDLEDEKRFAGDILLTYLLNPGTAVHVGYTDNYENLDLMDTMPRSLRRVRSPFNSTGRQVFFKVSYLWRK